MSTTVPNELKSENFQLLSEYRPLIEAQANIIPQIEARKSKTIMRSPVEKFERVIVKSESTL